MKLIVKNILLLLLLAISFGFSSKQDDPAPSSRKQAEKINLKGFRNLYKLNDSLYRSEQPDKKDMPALQQLGIRTIVSLRYYHRNDRKSKDSTVSLQHLPTKTRAISYNYVLKVLKTIERVEKPALIHCMHGSDRTGCIVASYRMVYDNWSKEEALAEFQAKQFGYHENWYPELLTFLQSLDISQLKKDLHVKE